MFPFKILLLYILIGICTVFCLSSCTNRYRVYFNTYYNANKFFEQAIRERSNRLKKNPLDSIKITDSEKDLFNKAIQKASKVIKLYSKKDQTYISNSLYILVESYYYLGHCNKSIHYYQKLDSFFPNRENKELSQFHYLECALLKNTSITNKNKFLTKLDKIKNKKIKISILQTLAELEEKENNFNVAVNFYQKIIEEPIISNFQKNLILLKQATLTNRLKKWDKSLEILSQIKVKFLNYPQRYERFKLKLQTIKHRHSRKESIKILKQNLKDNTYIDNQDELLFLLSMWLVEEKKIDLAFVEWNKLVYNLDLKKNNIWRAKSLYQLMQYYYYNNNSKEKRTIIYQECISTNLSEISRQCRNFSKVIEKIKILNRTDRKEYSLQYQHHFEIAEIFLLELNIIDSATTYLNLLISNLISTPFRDKALFNLAHIYSYFKKDTIQSNRIYQQIIQEYPNSIYSSFSQRKIYQKVIKIGDEEKANQLYLKAEDKPSQSIQLLEKIIKKYPKSKIYIKAKYKLSTLYEEKYTKTEKIHYLYLAQKGFHKVAYSQKYPFDSLAKLKIYGLNLSLKDSISPNIEFNDISVNDFFGTTYTNNDYENFENSSETILNEEEEEELYSNE